MGEEEVGVYKTFGPKPGESDYTREFSGKIKGYNNEAIEIANKYSKAGEEPRSVETVSLVWSNQEYDANTHSIENTIWKRQDGHGDKIPFP